MKSVKIVCIVSSVTTTVLFWWIKDAQGQTSALDYLPQMYFSSFTNSLRSQKLLGFSQTIKEDFCSSVSTHKTLTTITHNIIILSQRRYLCCHIKKATLKHPCLVKSRSNSLQTVMRLQMLDPRHTGAELNSVNNVLMKFLWVYEVNVFKSCCRGWAVCGETQLRETLQLTLLSNRQGTTLLLSGPAAACGLETQDNEDAGLSLTRTGKGTVFLTKNGRGRALSLPLQEIFTTV